ncbi:Transposable element Tc1 transposase [Anthophora quadrimaculata]
MISSKGIGRLHIVESTMRQDQYIKVLETKLLLQIGEWFPNGEEYIFMHDSAPCHTAKTATAYLTNKKIQVLPWPGDSPDMNPIENLWELLKRCIASETVTNKQQLIDKIIFVWHHDQEMLENCRKNMESMPKRIQAIIDTQGGETKY